VYWIYGSYTGDSNASVIASKIEVIKNAGGEMQSRRYRHDVRGFLSGSSQSDITLAMNGLISALAVPYQNFIFYQDDGSPSATTLMNGPSLSGVTVVEGPNFVESTGAEYATQREFTFAVEAEYALSGTVGLLLMFHEQLDFKGGGPRLVHHRSKGSGSRRLILSPSRAKRSATSRCRRFRLRSGQTRLLTLRTR